MQALQRDELKFGSGKVTYKGTFLGESRGAIEISRKASIHEIKKEKISIVADCSIVTGIKLEISMTLIAAEDSVEEFFNLQTLLTAPSIGSDLANTAGELVIKLNDTDEEHTFPNVVIDPEFKRHLGAKNHIVDVVFYSFSNS
ncbi:MAG: hypothetical protein WCS27_12890 [Victivallaceae bacterium]